MTETGRLTTPVTRISTPSVAVALFNAATLMALNPGAQGKSFWEVEGAAA